MTATVLSIVCACAGRRISPMLITPFTEFAEGHRYQGTDGITGTDVLRYTWPSPLYEISTLHACVRFCTATLVRMLVATLLRNNVWQVVQILMPRLGVFEFHLCTVLTVLTRDPFAIAKFLYILVKFLYLVYVS